MKQFNKTTAAAVAGFIATLIAAFVDFNSEQIAAVQGLVTVALVYFIGNKT